MTDKPFDPQLIELLRQEIAQMVEHLQSEPAAAGFKPLPITCKMTSCNNGRHCLDFMARADRGRDAAARGGCRDCGRQIVQLPEFANSTYDSPELHIEILRNQQHELMRAHYWTSPIDLRAYNQALRRGRTELIKRVEARVTAALTRDDAWSGRAAPYAGDIVAYAQHATATCCRNCAAYWLGLPRIRTEKPSAAQLKHAVNAAISWVAIRLPALPEGPQKVGPVTASVLPSNRSIVEWDDLVLTDLAKGKDPTGVIVPENTHLKVTRNRTGLLVSRTINFDPSGEQQLV